MPNVPNEHHNPVGWGSRLFNIGLGLLCAAGAYYVFKAQVRTPLHLALGLCIMGLSFLPSLLWAKKARPTLPVFEALIFTCFNTYALPLLNGHEDLLRYSEAEVTKAALAIIIYLGSAICTYVLVSPAVSAGRFWTQDVLGKTLNKWIGYGVALNTVYVVISSFTTLIPSSINSVLRAVFFGLGIISVFVTSRRLGLGELSQGERAWFALNLAIQCVCMMASLFLVSAISLLLLTLVGYISSSGKVPVTITAICLATLAILHNGKAAMRAKYWEPIRVAPTIAQLPAFYNEWLQNGIHYGKEKEEEDKRLAAKLIDRTSLIHILCLVTTLSPDPLNYLYGETYADIPAQFIPRLIWPNKPPGHISTSRLSVYYGLQNEEDTLKTTIGFGMVSEGFANFGFVGLIGLGLIVGFAFKKIMSAAACGPLFSYGGLFTIILMAWSFQVEFTLSLWLSSLYQATLVVLGIPFILRNFFQGNA